MRLDVLISEAACFHYWVQAVSGWDPHAIDGETYEYYAGTLSAEHGPILGKIRAVLQGTKEPRRVLAELYSGNAKTHGAKEIETLARPLSEAFESIWRENLSHLEKWRFDLRSIDPAKFAKPMQEIIDFLDSDITLHDTFTLYLVQNPPGHGPAGLAISNTDFILVRPSNTQKRTAFSNTLSVIAHEYIHAIEQRSGSSRELFKRSYDKYISAIAVTAPIGYTWKMMYVEALVYCFASTVTRGYLSPEIYGKPRPTVSEMENGFREVMKRNDHTATDIINWIGLNLLPDVEKYIMIGKKIDQHIADKISELLLEFYSAGQQKSNTV